jgi:hypothetical protein
LKTVNSEVVGLAPDHTVFNSGKPPPDDMTLSALAVKSGTKIMMMGSSEQVCHQDFKQEQAFALLLSKVFL